MVLLPCEAVQTATTSYTANLSVCFRSSILPQRIRCAVLADCISATLHRTGQSSRHNLSIMHECHDKSQAFYKKLLLNLQRNYGTFSGYCQLNEYTLLSWGRVEGSNRKSNKQRSLYSAASSI